ncbi:hypothetical protein [Magnetospirillum sp. 64-120]|uniref:hypothetical protein n=1 Tax=Magnetospirillum sp. 64-120 TaxID=1895778 RepID=UPI0009284202|nr:hypothetical protein [Magnetospirillum sp. 64-120]OJX77438.1 MAG: hypothetical protein BGO92_10435 [Magnetospirillum sp. 64-120]
MTASVNHQQLNADRQRAEVRRRVQDAMAVIRAEIGPDGAYPHNKGRITIAEVLRRAGGVDKNTLKASYHQALRSEVEAFVASFSPEREAKPSPSAPQGPRHDLERLAQALVAAQVVRDEALARVAELEEQMAVMRTNLVPFGRKADKP